MPLHRASLYGEMLARALACRAKIALPSRAVESHFERIENLSVNLG